MIVNAIVYLEFGEGTIDAFPDASHFLMAY